MTKRRIPNKITTSDTRAFLYILLFGGIVFVGGLMLLFGWDTYVDSDDQAAVAEIKESDDQEICSIPTGMEEPEEAEAGDTEGEGLTDKTKESDLVSIFKSQEAIEESHLQER